MNSPARVFIVDDDPGMLKSLERLLRAEGFAVSTFATAKDFLETYRSRDVGCLVLDVSMPGITGIELQEQLARSGGSLPIVFLTGHGDIPMSVRAMKGGAVDFLTKPVEDGDLFRAIRTALRKAAEGHAEACRREVLRQRLSELTPRELEVLKQVIAGKLNKQIAAELGTGEQNIKIHRGRVMKKMGVESLPELVRAAESLGVPPAGF